MILIISKSMDSHTDIVAAALKHRGADFARLDTDSPVAQFPKTVRFSSGWSGSILDRDLRTVALQDVQVVWYRRHAKPASYAVMSVEDEKFAYQEYKHFLAGLWYLLRGRLWINGMQATEAAEIKPYQLEIAQSLGLDIPRTVMTNDPAEAFAFFEECRGRVIYKTFHPVVRRDNEGKALGVYTTPVRREDLVSRRDAISVTPCIFQEYVEKQTELRVTIIGRKVFAAEINTSSSTRGRDDWRRYDSVNTVYRPYPLPDSVGALLLQLLDHLNLVFGCIDMVVTPDNRFVFLEINPMGEWLWIEQRTEMPLLAHFTEMLIQATQGYSEPVPPLTLASVMENG